MSKVPSESKRDLSKSKTNKKQMKKFKIVGLVTAVVLIFVAIAIGVIRYKIGEDYKNDLLTQKTIVKTMKKHGVSLKEDKSKDTNDYNLNGVKPAIFNVGKDKDTLLLYMFKSIGERKDVVRDLDNKIFESSLMEYPFNAKNAYLIYLIPENKTSKEEFMKFGETMKLISDITFKYLNDGKEIIYSGESEHWKATYTIKYYDHWWEDETGKLKVDINKREYPKLKYKMSNIADIGPIEVQYKTPTGGGSTNTDGGVNKDGYLNMGSSGSNSSIPMENEEISFNIKWNRKEENIILKAQ